MAPSHLDYQHHIDHKPEDNHNIGYMHKKFNCAAYTHKKFGSTFARSRSVESLKIVEETKLSVSKLKNVVEQQYEDDIESHKIAQHKRNTNNSIFRPYALGDNTPRKRRQHQGQQQQQHHHHHHVGATQLQQMRKLYQSEGANLHQLSSKTAAASTAVTVTASPKAQQQQSSEAHPTYAMNHQTFTLMLQKQREALHVRNMLQLSGSLSPSYSLWPVAIHNNQC